jgi:hypothetical protein
MNDDAIWSLEEQFWFAGEAHYRSALDPECNMGFPAPVEIMMAKAILGKSCANTSLVLRRIERKPRRASRVRPDSAGLSSARQSIRAETIRSVLHLVISGDHRWLETLPASADPDSVQQCSRVRLTTIAAEAEVLPLRA